MARSTILVIDDEPNILTTVRRSLEIEGFHVEVAGNGALGAFQANDVVMAMSYSGETEELTGVLETLKRIGAPLIAITGDTRSTLAQAANVALDCRVSEEACPMNLVPTASTTLNAISASSTNQNRNRARRTSRSRSRWARRRARCRR